MHDRDRDRDRDHLQGDGNVTIWRLQQLEEEIKELVRALQGSTSALGAQITALSNQLGSGLATLPEHYAPRREANERHAAINDRFDAMDKRLNERRENVDARFAAIEKMLDARINANMTRIERIERAGWAFAAGMVMMLLGVVFAVFRTMNGGG